MYLPESLLWCFYPECDLSGVQIFCNENQSEEIVREFKEIFWEKYNGEVQGIIEEGGDLEDYEFGEAAEPLGAIEVTEYGVFIQIGNLSIFNTWATGDNCILDHCNALTDTLEDLCNKYPDIRIKGYVGYCWSDSNGGGAVQYDISFPEEEEPECYDFVGEKISEKFADEEYLEEYYDQFVDAIAEDAEDFIEVIEKHKQWIDDDAINCFAEKFEEEEDFVQSLQELIEE